MKRLLKNLESEQKVLAVIGAVIGADIVAFIIYTILVIITGLIVSTH